MTRKPKLERNRFTFKLYVRSLPSGQIYYVRFYDKNSSMILADRSTGEHDEKLAYMADDFVTVLQELERVASILKFDNDDDFAIFNTKRGVPVAESTIKRGYSRVLALIGIEDDPKANKEGRPGLSVADPRAVGGIPPS